MCTCQGAAFEYIFNIDHEAKKAGVRDNVDLSGFQMSHSWVTLVWVDSI